jgi:hypothetical protein
LRSAADPIILADAPRANGDNARRAHGDSQMLCGKPLAALTATTTNSSPAMTIAHAGAKTKTALTPTIRGIKSGSHSLASLKRLQAGQKKNEERKVHLPRQLSTWALPRDGHCSGEQRRYNRA